MIDRVTGALYARTPNFALKIGSEEFTGIGQFQTAVTLGNRGNVTPIVPPVIGPEAGRGQRGGFLLAWDPVTQKERWRRPGGGGTGGGTITTAGNLVIQVVPDGRLVADSADQGEKLLDVQTSARNGLGPPITYLLDGKQYISFLGGRGGTANSQPQPPPRVFTFTFN